jgi:hypothetical protein
MLGVFILKLCTLNKYRPLSVTTLLLSLFSFLATSTSDKLQVKVFSLSGVAESRVDL